MVTMGVLAAVVPDSARPPATAATAATAAWLGTVAAFADAAEQPSPAAAAATHGRLRTITSLDPSFSEAWTYGATMLRVLDGPSGAHARAFVDAGRAQRPDLPWRRIAPDAR